MSLRKRTPRREPQPEKEEQEEAERMEILQKEDEMMDKAIGNPAEKPPVTCASLKASPEVKTSRTLPGE